jgi:hypothetical protein
VGTLSVLRFIPMGVFDGATIRTIGKAFDAACKELRDGGQPAVVHEVMVKRIIAAAEEANVIRRGYGMLHWPKKAKKRNSWIGNNGQTEASACPLASRTMNQESVSSAVQGDGRRRDPQEGCALR